jgi:hypothetical protein
MRVVVLLSIALAACTPDVASETYYCGPNAACPEGQLCNGPDYTCVLPSSATAFACDPKIPTEPDDTAAQAHALPTLVCEQVPFVDENCLLEGDAEDWVKFQAPTGCLGGIELEATVYFPIAFARIAIELWNLDTMTKLDEDAACTQTAEAGEDNRCITVALTPGTNYGIKVRPAGDRDCDGGCRYNFYRLTVGLSAP